MGAYGEAIGFGDNLRIRCTGGSVTEARGKSLYAVEIIDPFHARITWDELDEGM